MPNIGTGVEKLDWELWDSGSPGGAGVALTLFQVPLGQATKTVYDTNMRLAGTLQMPSSFDIMAVWIAALPGAAVADVIALSKGTLELYVGHKVYVQEVLAKLTGGGGMNLQVSMLGNDAGQESNFGVPHARNLHTLQHPVTVQHGEHFRVEIVWPAAPGDKTFYVGLVGVMNRAIQ